MNLHGIRVKRDVRVSEICGRIFDDSGVFVRDFCVRVFGSSEFRANSDAAAVLGTKQFVVDSCVVREFRVSVSIDDLTASGIATWEERPSKS